jgi:cell division protein ZapA (FtsZ GTPase activity inhibitor)
MKMAKLSIKVVVAGRTYPLTVEETEEAGVQEAANDINKRIQFLKDNYAVKDVQDLLAMTALQVAVKKGEASPSAAIQQDLSAPSQALEALLEALNK